MKEQNLRFEFQEDPSPDNEKILFDGLNDDASEKMQMSPIRTFGIFVRDPEDKSIGGLSGILMYGSLYVDMLWVHKEYRQQSLGTELMNKAERIARENGCTFSTVNTMDWEALPFYQKLGYHVEFVREGFVKNTKMLMLRKQL
jgi:ribosomal protein S18 acetylase RimI-like enzyme